jgi:nucleoid-associated protein YgaU
MPREKDLSSRLDSLLEAVFGDRPDLFAIFRQIASELPPSQHLAFKKRIRRTLRAKAPIGTDSALLVACVLRLTGFAPHRLLHFLSLYVPGTLRLSQFEFAAQALFSHGAPIPETILYDLTQHTYLEKRLLVRKSMEVSARLRDDLSPDLLLNLYLLSLRDDLSDENVHLIALIMKNCFPALELRPRLGGATLEEYGEIAKAWRYAEQRSLSLDAGKSDAARAVRPFNRESASFFLDKYFSDAALLKQQEEAAMEALVAPRPARPRQPVRRPPRQAPRRAHAVAASRWRLALMLPSSVAAALVLALTVIALRFLPLPAGRAPDAAAPSAPAAEVAPAAQTAPVAPDSVTAVPQRTYIVQKGDSLWKIYQSLGADTPSQWEEFVSRMRVENSLIDPDRIWPGRVLKLQPTGN